MKRNELLIRDRTEMNLTIATLSERRQTPGGIQRWFHLCKEVLGNASWHPAEDADPWLPTDKTWRQREGQEDEITPHVEKHIWGWWGCAGLSHSVMSSSFQPHGLQPTRLLCPWDSPGKKTGVGCHFLLQGIFPTQESNLCLSCLPHCRRILYC